MPHSTSTSASGSTSMPHSASTSASASTSTIHSTSASQAPQTETTKTRKQLPNTGETSTNSALAGLGLLTLAGAALRRKQNQD